MGKTHLAYWNSQSKKAGRLESEASSFGSKPIYVVSPRSFGPPFIGALVPGPPNQSGATCTPAWLHPENDNPREAKACPSLAET